MRSSLVPAVLAAALLDCCWPTLRSQRRAYELFDRQRHDAEHQVAEHFAVSAHAHVPSSKLVFEPPVDSLHRRALVVAARPRRQLPDAVLGLRLPLQLRLLVCFPARVSLTTIEFLGDCMRPCLGPAAKAVSTCHSSDKGRSR